MLDQLKTPPEGFENIIKTHFKLKSRSLRRQLDQWLDEDDGKPLNTDSMQSIHGASASTSASAAVGGTTAPVAVTGSGAANGDGTSGTAGTAASAGPSKASSAFAKDVAEIKKLLDKLDMEEM